MVMALLFGGVALIALLVLYNQGILVRSKVQIENASDAAVYSVAKLSARHMNASAYLNRAMVANDVLVGQASGLVSVINKYESSAQYVNSYPLYQIPLTPVSPVPRVADLFMPAARFLTNGVGTPLRLGLGNTATFVGRASAGFNQLLGLFEHVFGAATVATQFMLAEEVVRAHATDRQLKDGTAPDIPSLGYFFLAQNTAQTYFGDHIEWDNINAAYQAIRFSPFTTDAERVATENYIQRNQELIGNSLLHLNSFKVNRGAQGRSGGAPGSNANQEAALALQKSEAHRYAAIVNDNSGKFVENRGGDNFAVESRLKAVLNPTELPFLAQFLPSFILDNVPISIELKLDLQGALRVGSQGGSSYRYLEASKGKSEDYGWSSVDLMLGSVELGVTPDSADPPGKNEACVRVSIPFVFSINECLGYGSVLQEVLDAVLKEAMLQSLGQAPFGGGTHQYVKSASNRLIGYPSPEDAWAGGRYGALMESDNRAKYSAPLTWLNVSNQAFTTSNSRFVNTGAGGLPTFWSVNPALRNQNRSPAFAMVVMQDVKNLSTSDNLPDNKAIGVKDSKLPPWLNPSLKTESFSANKNTPFGQVGDFLGGGTPMVNLSSAELYHNRRDQDERANLFSPFWEARLTENSPLHTMVLRGFQNPANFIRGLAFNPQGTKQAVAEYARLRAQQETDVLLDDFLNAQGVPSFLHDPTKDFVRSGLAEFQP